MRLVSNTKTAEKTTEKTDKELNEYVESVLNTLSQGLSPSGQRAFNSIEWKVNAIKDRKTLTQTEKMVKISAILMSSLASISR